MRLLAFHYAFTALPVFELFAVFGKFLPRAKVTQWGQGNTECEIVVVECENTTMMPSSAALIIIEDRNRMSKGIVRSGNRLTKQAVAPFKSRPSIHEERVLERLGSSPLLVTGANCAPAVPN